jgi:hypothetical protein
VQQDSKVIKALFAIRKRVGFFFAKMHFKSTFIDNEKFTKMYNKETITKGYEKDVI